MRASGDQGQGADAPSLEVIQEAVCTVLAIPIADLRSTRRTPQVARARQLAMYLGRELTPSSLSEIARAFNRDHTTVLHAVRAVGKRLEPGSDTQQAIHSVRRMLEEPGASGLEAASAHTTTTPIPNPDPQVIHPTAADDPA